jgi:hypothetical protein
MALPVDAAISPTMWAQSVTIPPSLSGLPTHPIAPTLENDGLLQYVARSVDEDEDFYFLRFESLQRINIAALQIKLVRFKDSLRSQTDISDSDLENLRVTLEQYSQSNLNAYFAPVR